VTLCEARVIQVLPLRRCNETVPVNEALLAVRVPVIAKGVLTVAEEGAEMVRAVGVLVGVTVAVGVLVGVTVAVGVLVGVTVAVGVLVGMTVAVGVLVGVTVAVAGFASTTILALQNNNTQITSTTTTVAPLFKLNIPPHLER
jgi:hypothetical protein